MNGVFKSEMERIRRKSPEGAILVYVMGMFCYTFGAEDVLKSATALDMDAHKDYDGEWEFRFPILRKDGGDDMNDSIEKLTRFGTVELLELGNPNKRGICRWKVTAEYPMKEAR